jgi:hypothetical protein
MGEKRGVLQVARGLPLSLSVLRSMISHRGSRMGDPWVKTGLSTATMEGNGAPSSARGLHRATTTQAKKTLCWGMVLGFGFAGITIPVIRGAPPRPVALLSASGIPDHSSPC